jgi:serine protease Do
MKKFILVMLFSVLTLSGCYGVQVTPVLAEQSLTMPQDARPSPIWLSKMQLAIQHGDTIGSVSPRGMGILCRGPYGVVSRASVTSHMESKSMRDAFNDTLSAQGYDVAGASTVMFDEDDDQARSIYLVAARITDIKMDVCQRVTFLFAYDLGYTGEASMEVEWTVYDRLRRVVVYKTITRGYSKMDLPNYEAIDMMIDDSFGVATNNLGADPKFHDLLVTGIKPPKAADKAALFGPVGKFAPDDAVAVGTDKLRDKMDLTDLEHLRRAAVLISTGAGHGSGFFISDHGHIITNAHVVGDADLVRVVTSGRQYKLVADVIRKDKERDVALLRIEDMPEDFKPVVLPIRSDIPRVGEDVYAIGAPLSEKDLQDTVTKGIVSAWRPSDRMTRQSYIQADVDVQPGNSGGPLLDARGNILGLTVAGYNDDAGSAAGLNLFIPIGEALKKLDIGLTGEPVDLVTQKQKKK